MTRLRNPRFLFVLRIFLALVMFYAAIPKLFDWSGFPPTLDFSPFARMVYNYKVLPVQLVNLVAFALPPIETFGALCLLTGIWLRAGGLMLSGLQLVFLMGMFQAWMRGLDIQCGCFVGIDEKVGLLTLTRDSLLFIGFVLVFLGPVENLQKTGPEGESPPGVDVSETPPPGTGGKG